MKTIELRSLILEKWVKTSPKPIQFQTSKFKGFKPFFHFSMKSSRSVASNRPSTCSPVWISNFKFQTLFQVSNLKFSTQSHRFMFFVFHVCQPRPNRCANCAVEFCVHCWTISRCNWTNCNNFRLISSSNCVLLIYNNPNLNSFLIKCLSNENVLENLRKCFRLKR